MGFLARKEVPAAVPDQSNTPPEPVKEWWWQPPRSEAEELALGYITVVRKHAEQIIAFAKKYPSEFHVVREMLVEAEFAAGDIGPRMEEMGATIDQMEKDAQRLLGRRAGGLGIE